MKNITLFISVAVGMALSSCGTGNYTANGNGGFVNSIYYTSDASVTPTTITYNTSSADVQQLQSKTNTAIAETNKINLFSPTGKSYSDTIYVGANNVVDVDYNPYTDYTIIDDEESYEERLRKFDSPTYTVNIEVDPWDFSYYNPFWSYRYSWYRPFGIAWYSGWYNPFWSSYLAWDLYWGWGWSPFWSWYDPWWYWGHAPWPYAGPHRGGWSAPRYYGRRDASGTRSTRRVGTTVPGNRYTSSRTTTGVTGIRSEGSGTRRDEGSTSRRSPTMGQIRGTTTHSVGTTGSETRSGESTNRVVSGTTGVRTNEGSTHTSSVTGNTGGTRLGTNVAGTRNTPTSASRGTTGLNRNGVVYSTGASNSGFSTTRNTLQPSSTTSKTGTLNSGTRTYRQTSSTATVSRSTPHSSTGNTLYSNSYNGSSERSVVRSSTSSGSVSRSSYSGSSRSTGGSTSRSGGSSGGGGARSSGGSSTRR